MTISRNVVKNMRDDFQKDLAAFAAKYGVDVEVGTMRFDEVQVSFKTTLKLQASANPTGKSADQVAFERTAWKFGLGSNDFGKQFTQQGQTFEITGLAKRAKKYPILAKNVHTGETFKFTQISVQKGLGII